MLAKYSNFLNDLILEKALNESVVYFSPKFRRSLKRIEDNKIASNLLEIEGDDIKPDLTFIDMDDKEGYISFTTMKNAWKKLSNEYSHIEYITNTEDKPKDFRVDVADQIYNSDIVGPMVYSKSRNPLKIGKFVNKSLPGKYNSQDIEEFTNLFKAGIESATERFELVEGDDIAFWYKGENYKEIKGQLGNSCMRNNSASTFDIYTKNPEVCKMLVLIEDGELLGRALIWKLKSVKSYGGKDFPDVLYFMDRQYTINDHDVDKFRNYAKEKGWSYKTNNSHHSLSSITYKDNTFNVNMSVQLKEESKNDYDYGKYPYMDTFRRYDPSNGILHNDDDESTDYEGDYLLHDTSGGYQEIQGGVWSEWHGENISEDDAVWSDWADSYVDRNASVYIDEGYSGNHGWYPDECDDIVYDEYHEIHIHIDDSVYSEAYGYSLLSEKAIEVISDVYKDGDPEVQYDNWYPEDAVDIVHRRQYSDTYWFKRLSDEYDTWEDYPGALDSLFVLNYDGEYVLDIFSIKEYEIKEPKSDSVSIPGIEYLTKLDAEILGYEIDESSSRVVDKFEYYYLKEDILHLIYRRAESMIENLRNEIDGKGQQKIKFPDDNEEERKKLLSKKISNLDEKMEEIAGELFIDFDEPED